MDRFSSRSGYPLRLLETVIESDRLRLTPTAASDADAIFESFTADVARYMFPEPARRLEETLEFIRKSREATETGDNLQLTIASSATGEFLGCCGLHGYASVRVPELGVWIKQQAHGHGYGKEAVVALVHWAVEHLDVSGFTYPVDRRNAASRRIPEALGGEVVGTALTEGLGGNRLEVVTYRIAAGKTCGGPQAGITTAGDGR